MSDYAVPARRHDLRGLPPTWISVSDLDLFLAEDVDYAERLASSDVPVKLEIVPGAPHGFERWAPDAEISRGMLHRARSWLAGTLQSV